MTCLWVAAIVNRSVDPVVLVAPGNTPQQRFMGRWSDGAPVKELVVTDDP